MTFREKLADWISGGALSLARSDVEWWRDQMVSKVYVPMVGDKNREIMRLQRDCRSLHDSIEKAVTAGAEIHGRNEDARLALRAIIAMETPSANATVRRMARRAREALAR